MIVEEHMTIKELAKKIISEMDTELLLAKTSEVYSELSAIASVQYEEDPALFESMVAQANKKDSQACALFIACMLPDYFIKNVSQFTARDMTAGQLDGRLKGKNVLWVLSFATAWSKCDALISVLQHFESEIKAEDFAAQAQDGVHEGKTSFWFLCLAAILGNSEALILVLNQCNNDFTADTFTAQAQGSRDKGISALWLLSAIAPVGNSVPFLQVLKQHINKLNMVDFTAEAREGPNEGECVLLMLSSAAAEGKTEGLMLVLSHINFNKKSLEDIKKEFLLPKECKSLIDAKIKRIDSINNENKKFSAQATTQAWHAVGGPSSPKEVDCLDTQLNSLHFIDFPYPCSSNTPRQKEKVASENGSDDHKKNKGPL